jgi:hypothetical protein
MDPVTVGAVLLTIVGGAAGQASGRLWNGVHKLISLQFGHSRSSEDGSASVHSGEAEFAALEQSPADQERAVALAATLLERADEDAEFRQQLDAWWQQASQILPGEGNVSNVISGGNFSGPVLQGRDFTGLTFGPAADL